MRRRAMQKTTGTWPQIQYSDLQWQEFLMLNSNPQASLQPPPKAPEDWEKPREHDNLWAKALEEIPSAQSVCSSMCENSCACFCSYLLVLLITRYNALKRNSYPLNLFAICFAKTTNKIGNLWHINTNYPTIPSQISMDFEYFYYIKSLWNALMFVVMTSKSEGAGIFLQRTLCQIPFLF